jgi:chromosome segregation ATPase
MATLQRPKKKTPSVELERLRSVVHEERSRLRQLERDRQAAGQRVVALREELIEARAAGLSGDEQRAELQKAEDHPRDHFNVEIEAQGRRVRAAEQSVGRYVSEHLDELGREQLARAKEVRDSIFERLDGLEADITRYEGEAQTADDLIREAGLIGRDEGAPMPNLDKLKAAIRDTREAGLKLPAARRWSDERHPDVVSIRAHPPVEGAGFVT